MQRLFWIALGGAIGTSARYGVGLWTARRFGTAFPYGTAIVNLAGCFVIAFVMHAALKLDWPPTLRLAIVVGGLGGLTTYSSFNYETMRLMQDGRLDAALFNAVLTIAGGLIAGGLGLLCGRLVLGAG